MPRHRRCLWIRPVPDRSDPDAPERPVPVDPPEPFLPDPDVPERPIPDDACERGRERAVRSTAIGGAISGFAAGLMYGIFSSLATAVYSIVEFGDIGAALTGSTTTLITSCCGAIIFGSILGAVGGAVWVATQGNKGR